MLMISYGSCTSCTVQNYNALLYCPTDALSDISPNWTICRKNSIQAHHTIEQARIIAFIDTSLTLTLSQIAFTYTIPSHVKKKLKTLKIHRCKHNFIQTEWPIFMQIEWPIPKRHQWNNKYKFLVIKFLFTITRSSWCSTFICDIVEDVESFSCRWSFLLVAEDEVNPVVQVVGHMLTFLYKTQTGFPIITSVFTYQVS